MYQVWLMKSLASWVVSITSCLPTRVLVSSDPNTKSEEFLWVGAGSTLVYCTFHKHANSKVQKPPSQLCFSLPSIIITITSNEPWNRETRKTDRNQPITNHKPWPFKPVKVKFCFLRGPLRWLTAAKNAIVSWFLNFGIHMFVKSAVTFFIYLFIFIIGTFFCFLFWLF